VLAGHGRERDQVDEDVAIDETARRGVQRDPDRARRPLD
jgi:hypothetical protein